MNRVIYIQQKKKKNWIGWYRAGFSKRIGYGFGRDREKPKRGWD